MRKDRAFTLIELLVVIAVIAVLLGILMPSLSLVREQARMISCASNQKQLILGLVGYATENDDKLPPSPVKLGAISAKKANYHHPMELNMHYSNAWGPVSNVQDRNYAFAGKYLSGYLPEVDVYNCKVAPIKPEDPWPPPGANIAWYSCHNMKNSLRSAGSPFYMQGKSNRRIIPDVSLNTGYLDGHVSRFHSSEGLRVGANAHEAIINRQSR